MSNLDVFKKGKNKDLAPRAIKRLKLRTIANPTDADAWYELSLYLFDLGKNDSGWTCLTNAKKLGSIDALVKIEEILKQYGKNVNAIEELKGQEE